MKEGSEFYARIKVEKDIQEKKFEGERLVSHIVSALFCLLVRRDKLIQLITGIVWLHIF